MIYNDTTDPIGTSQTAHWGLWGTAIWGAVITLIFLALQIISILVLAAFRGTKVSDPKAMGLFIASVGNGYLLSITVCVTTVICCALIVGVIKLKKGSVLREYLDKGGSL